MKVGDLILEDTAGFACAKSKLVVDGVPQLRPFNIGEDGSLDTTDLYRVPLSVVPRGRGDLEQGDILFNNTNSADLVGKSALVQRNMPYGFSNHISRVRLDKERVEPAYFLYWLMQIFRSGYFKAHATQWVSQAAYRVSDLAKLTIELPSLTEQRRIVDILDRATAIQKLRKQAEAKAQEIIPALFLDMFGDPAANPHNWAVGTIEACGEVQGGIQVSAKREALHLKRPYLRVANVYRSRLELAEIKMIGVTEAEAARARLERGDVLVVEGHGNANEVGRAAVWDGSIADCIHQNHLIRIRPDQSVLHPTFLDAFLNSQSGRQILIKSGKTTSGLSTISTKNVKNVQIIVPPISLQRDFAAKSEALQSLTALSKKALTHVANLQHSLSAQVMGNA